MRCERNAGLSSENGAMRDVQHLGDRRETQEDGARALGRAVALCCCVVVVVIVIIIIIIARNTNALYYRAAAALIPVAR